MRINESNSSLQPAIALVGHILCSSTFPTFPNSSHPRAHILSSSQARRGGTERNGTERNRTLANISIDKVHLTRFT